MNWIIIIDARAEKRLRKFPDKDYERIRRIINVMEVDPFFGNVSKLIGKGNSWRRRTGNYRIFYEIYESKKLIYISDIKRRTSSTYINKYEKSIGKFTNLPWKK
jgi:mRNA-degrading endonuclease RelE of RelBE toxin-antitoxin system